MGDALVEVPYSFTIPLYYVIMNMLSYAYKKGNNDPNG